MKSPASGAGNVSEPMLMSQVGRVREVVCAYYYYYYYYKSFGTERLKL
jgi:hypothetical protein